MSNTVSRKLAQVLEETLGNSPLGITLETAAALQWTEETRCVILAALECEDTLENSLALFVIRAVSGKIHNQNAADFLARIKTGIFKFLHHEDDRLRTDAMEAFAEFSQVCSDAREVFLNGLKDESPLVRLATLKAWRLFLKPTDIELLEQFSSDSYETESGMGGPVCFPIRELAAEIRSELSQQTCESS